MLSRELRALEQQSVASGNFAGLINEALQSYKENSFDTMFLGNQINLPNPFLSTLDSLTLVFYARHVQYQRSRMKSYLDTTIYQIR